MPSSDFAPFGGSDTPSEGFRPFDPKREERADGGTADDLEAAAPPAAPAVDPLDAAREEAYAAGFAAGRESRDDELTEVHARLRDSIDGLVTFQDHLRKRTEQELLELALGVARKVVLQELAERPQIWLGMI